MSTPYSSFDIFYTLDNIIDQSEIVDVGHVEETQTIYQRVTKEKFQIDR
jgi:hypothetical protein